MATVSSGSQIVILYDSDIVKGNHTKVMSEKIQAHTLQEIETRIYMLRGIQVMLDTHLAEFYDVKPIRLREQVKRNLARFPSNFMFQLTDEEVENMVSQNAIPSRQHLGGALPYVFTEQGVAMLSAVLRSETAIKVSIQIMNAFVEMRKILVNHQGLLQRMDRFELKQAEHEQKFEKVFSALEAGAGVPKQGIYFDGQTFDAYHFAAKLVRSAKTSIRLVDNYVDDSVLLLLTKREKGVSATLYCKNPSKSLLQDLKKHNEQYPSIELKHFDKSHDRFLIIDDQQVYHIGASLKDLGKKWFAFTELNVEAVTVIAKIKSL